MFSFQYFAVNAGKILNGWKLGKKLKISQIFHLSQDFLLILMRDKKRIKFSKNNKKNIYKNRKKI